MTTPGPPDYCYTGMCIVWRQLAGLPAGQAIATALLLLAVAALLLVLIAPLYRDDDREAEQQRATQRPRELSWDARRKIAKRQARLARKKQ